MLVRSPLLTSRRWRKLISSGRLICRCHHVFLWCYIYFALSRLTRDGTVEPVSRDQILRRERGQGNFHFLCSADHVQDWQPYPVDPYFCYMCDHTGRRPDSHTCFFFLFSFSLFGDVTFSEYFFVPLPFSLCIGEYVVRFFLPDGVFLPLLPRAGFLTSAYVRIRSNQCLPT